jgi:hypothetical protein
LAQEILTKLRLKPFWIPYLFALSLSLNLRECKSKNRIKQKRKVIPSASSVSLSTKLAKKCGLCHVSTTSTESASTSGYLNGLLLVQFASSTSKMTTTVPVQNK